VTFINGLTASAVVSRSDWPADKQVEQLRLQLHLLRAWASSAAVLRPDKLRKSSKPSASGSSAA
jgi:hypothetical protein